MDSEAFPLIAEIGATLAGFAAIAGVIRSDPVDRDAAFDIAAYGAMATVFALGAVLLADGEGRVIGLPALAVVLSAVSGGSALRNLALVRQIRDERREANAEREPTAARAMGFLSLPFICLIPFVSLSSAFGFAHATSLRLFALALVACLVVALALLLYLLAKHFVLQK